MSWKNFFRTPNHFELGEESTGPVPFQWPNEPPVMPALRNLRIFPESLPNLSKNKKKKLRLQLNLTVDNINHTNIPEEFLKYDNLGWKRCGPTALTVMKRCIEKGIPCRLVRCKVQYVNAHGMKKVRLHLVAECNNLILDAVGNAEAVQIKNYHAVWLEASDYNDVTLWHKITNHRKKFSTW